MTGPRRRDRGRGPVVVLVGLLVAGSVAVGLLVVGLSGDALPGGRGADDHARLIVPPGRRPVVDVLDAQRSKTFIEGMMFFCLDRPGRIEVTRVRPADGTLDLSNYLIRPNPYLSGGQMIGSWNSSLAGYGLGTGSPPLTLACDDRREADGYELVVELRASPRTTSSSGFVIEYRSEGRSDELLIPNRVVLCLHPGDLACAAHPDGTVAPTP